MQIYQKVILAVVAVALAGVGIYMYTTRKPAEQMACTMEAKLCPDGSYVGRQGPSCEFATCPGATSGWQTYSDNERGISFEYPETLGTTYIHTVDWPPVVSLKPAPFVCVETGSEITALGQTERVTINGHAYCVTKSSEGAAGSTYTKYKYAILDSDIGENLVPSLAFTLRFSQCGNYDDTQKTACENERESFNINSIVDRMAQSLVVITGK